MTYKWKPPKDNTIDFLVKYQRGDKGAFTIRFENTKSYKTLNLYIGYNPVQWEPITARKYLEKRLNVNVEYGPKLFLPADVNETFSQCQVEAIKEYNGRGSCEDGSEIEDNTIVECRYDNDRQSWIPIRIRKDKTEKYRVSNSLSRTANDYGSALNIWRSIVDPITTEIISGKEEVPLRNVILDDDAYYFRMIDREKMASKKMLDFHNYWVKLQLIKKFKGKESLMDIACGQAGDLHRWRDAEFKKILGVDYKRDNIENPKSGAYSRVIKAIRDPKIGNMKNKQFVFLTMDGGMKINSDYINELSNEDDKYIAQAIWGINRNHPLKEYIDYVANGFDVVSCQFAVHYFFMSEDKLDNFVYNVDKHLKEGGYFIGTCLDGQEIKKLLRSKKKGSHVTGKKDDRILWDICKKYDSNDDINYGDEIDIYMESIGKVTTEYLVNIDKLVEKLAKYNITLATDMKAIVNFKEVYNSAIASDETLENAYYLNSIKQMTEDEKRYSFLNMYFIFQKQAKAAEGAVVPRVIKRKIVVKDKAK